MSADRFNQKIGWKHFGTELKRAREEKGLSQTQLGALIFVSGSYVGQFESATRKPQLDVAERIDKALETDGRFGRMCKELVDSSVFEDPFVVAAELEQQAISICEHAGQLLPGLLQTEAYARAIYLACQPLIPGKELDQLVAARLERAGLLKGPTRPMLWVIIDESAIRRPLGGRVTMAEQLRHVTELAESGSIILQVLPFSAGGHALQEGSLRIMAFADAPPVAYVEAALTGQLIDKPVMVAKSEMLYDLARASALPCEASLALVKAAAEEYACEQ
ncbi:helix-turn-helix transcriptional regulator [Kitasatospora sp. NBC_01287]|uniref:helix-turn-helix domain-containing protein n=1 Tax=Kitasatospora sp. NBC_01287 TaxID=2903573 RepID=UPI002250B3C0|nr:helix-turn-helix transcriptional regulator [Kitasatospora sp. NBC_01287]MCX4748275.1 helix-turn-helix transcriptional regulator [Kitasatospora sp. NBC_01287]